MLLYLTCEFYFVVDSGESSGATAAPPGSTPETIPEVKGEEEGSETAAESAAAEPGKDTDISKGTEQETTDTKDAVAADGKASEASTSEMDKQTSEVDEPSKEDVKSEEQGTDAEKKDSSSEEKVGGAVKQEGEEERKPEDTENVFSPAALDRLLGLVGAILPQDSKVGHEVYNGGNKFARFQRKPSFGNSFIHLIFSRNFEFPLPPRQSTISTSQTRMSSKMYNYHLTGYFEEISQRTQRPPFACFLPV